MCVGCSQGIPFRIWLAHYGSINFVLVIYSVLLKKKYNVLLRPCMSSYQTRKTETSLYYENTPIQIHNKLFFYTSFIFPLIITKIRPSSFKIISWEKLEVSALFQSAQHVRNMSSYKTVKAPTTPDQKILRKTEISTTKKKKKRFLPQNEVCFHNTGKFLCLMKTILCHTKNRANSTFLPVKGTQIWPKKRPTLWEANNASKVPRRQRVICRGYL